MSIAIRIAFGATIYHIWKERNRRIFENQSIHKQNILSEILSSIKLKILYLRLEDPPNARSIKFAELFGFPIFTRSPPVRTCSWKPPDGDILKLNTDASLAEDKASIGGIIRDKDHIIKGAFSLDSPPHSINELEIESISKGIKLAISKGTDRLWIESDSLQAVSIIKGVLKCPWRQIAKVHQTLRDLNSLNYWHISHIWREANGAADFLSKTSCPIKGECISVLDLPRELLRIVASDSSGVPYVRM
ncbi:uncharacterized protein LOC143853222 [Tasmannia lanceolata]